MKNFLYSSYNDIDNSDSNLNAFINKYYTEKQSTKQYNAYKKLLHKTYKDKEEIGYDIEELSKVSGYRMKLLRLNNKNNITFVCSMSTKKQNDEVETNNKNGDKSSDVITNKDNSNNAKSACKHRIRFEGDSSDILFKCLKVHNHAPTETEEVSLIIIKNEYIVIYY